MDISQFLSSDLEEMSLEELECLNKFVKDNVKITSQRIVSPILKIQKKKTLFQLLCDMICSIRQNNEI